jgi:glycine cleavage system H protein
MIPSDLKFSQTHEWARLAGDVVTVGISQYAVEQLGDIVFVELPKPGKALAANAAFGVIESVKAAVELLSPVAGEVIEGNAAVTSDFQAISDDPYGKGWMIKVRIAAPSQLDGLMSPSQYEAFVQGEQAKH